MQLFRITFVITFLVTIEPLKCKQKREDVTRTKNVGLKRFTISMGFWLVLVLASI